MFRVRSKLLLIVCALAGCSVVAPVASAADAGYSYRANVGEVRLTLVATDRAQHYVRDLSPGQLAVIDNELVVRNFRSFTRTHEAQLRVVVLLDTSESVGQLRDQVGEILKITRAGQWEPVDSISVLTLGGSSENVICTKNCASTEAEENLSRLKPAGQTTLFDSILQAVDMLAVDADPQTRSVIIVFSDGQDNFSRSSASDAIEAAQRIDASIYAVNVNQAAYLGDGSRTLLQLSNATGGVRFSMRDGAARVLSVVLDDLRSSYTLSYIPPNKDEGEHSVRVLPTHNLDLTFRTRRTYIYRVDQQDSRRLP